ncbi:unnamed protein product [Dracunculus medinensis]|uniref:Osteoclast-stimulating factor 1 n=1 Tax=Dracunculus medinensis TaxID=318479 RepID=A0A0N4UNM6_DRAME|nr:unnamed protein product [Dracunculus medinensis]
MNTKLAPKPAPKPGRVTVYRAVSDYCDREMSFNEGDLLYVSEDTNNTESAEWLQARCGTYIGLVPRNCVMNAEYVDFPLHDAAKRGNIEFVKECIKNSVSVNSLDKSGSTALYWASHGGHTNIVEMLVTVPNICISAQNKLGDTALHAAAWKGYADCVRLLLNNGASTNLKNNDRKRPIDVARNVDCYALIQLAMRGTVHPEDSNDYLSDSETENSC